jgi:nitroreductase
MVHQPNRPRMSLTETIHRRTSIRTYTGEPLAPEHLTLLQGVAKHAPRLTQTPVRFGFIEGRAQVEHILKGIVGNYGKVQGAPALIVGISGQGPYPQESLGFAMEHLILEATRQNIGTCWNSGMFDSKHAEEQVSLEPGEQILAVSPVGYPAPSGQDKLLKTLVMAKKRKALKDIIYADSWRGNAQTVLDSRPGIESIAEAVRWAPSATNRQPWRMILTAKTVVLTSTRRNSGLDNGIAMAHWYIAAHEEGLPGNWDLEPDRAALRKTLSIPDNIALVGVYPIA